MTLTEKCYNHPRSPLIQTGLLNIIRNTKYKPVKKKNPEPIEQGQERHQESRPTNNASRKAGKQHMQTITRHQCHQQLQKAPTITEKKPKKKTITMEDKTLATKLDLDDRIYITIKRQGFITLKDNKPSFQNNPTCRLTNPTKPEIGNKSKQIRENINIKVRTATKLNQSKNTDKVIR